MSAMMIFLAVAAGVTVLIGLASWGYLSWEHRRERQRYAEHTARKQRTMAQKHWNAGSR